MNRTNFEHAAYALLMQLPFGLLGHWWVGAALSIGFFLGREHAQAQDKINDYSFHGDLAAFRVWQWPLDAKLDLLFPVVSVTCIAWLLS